MNRDLQDLLRQAKAAGATTALTRGGHIKVFIPGGRFVVISSTPSNWRSVLNARAELRRAGLDI